MLFFAHVGLALLLARPFKRVDLPFLAIGSVLPDIIDKPLGTILFGTSRIFGHTLLFLLLLAVLAIYLRDMRIASLCGGVFIHLGLDSMWASPATLLWPLLGLFPIESNFSLGGYSKKVVLDLNNPNILIPEYLGLVYLIYFAIERRSQILAKIRSIWTE